MGRFSGTFGIALLLMALLGPGADAAPKRPGGEGVEYRSSCTPVEWHGSAAFPLGERRSCPHLPKEIVPAAKRNLGHGHREMAVQRVSNEAGDELEVEIAIPSEPYGELFNKECKPIIPYREGRYNPCGYVTFYDAKWETSEKAPSTNIEEDAEYDACGKLVTIGKTEGWHVIGKTYTTPGWHAGYIQRIPYITPDECLGLWTLKWTYTQTFSDGETLSASVEVPFPVSDEPIPWDAFWGGGNPAELCSQACHGDPVNTASGDFYETTTDLAIPGRGPGLGMARTYSAMAARFGQQSPMGRGWSHPYDMSLYFGPYPKSVMVTNPNGSQTRFEALPGGGYAAAPRVLATLESKEGGRIRLHGPQ